MAINSQYSQPCELRCLVESALSLDVNNNEKPSYAGRYRSPTELIYNSFCNNSTGVNFGNNEFVKCHDDSHIAEEGLQLGNRPMFSWLGVLQYIHLTTGNPHYFRVPRVILISKQYVLCTAVDAAEVPEGHALGNVVFGDYERDEAECRITLENIEDMPECKPSILLMPISDVLLHPEYRHFKAKHSVAILKLATPIRSNYMLPVCLPVEDVFARPDGKHTSVRLAHLDFTSDVPRDFIEEIKQMTAVKPLPSEICFLFDDNENSTYEAKNRILCTTGCGLHSGAPSLIHEHTGHWTIVAMSMGYSQCPDPLRIAERPRPPARHINLLPYVPWITSAVAGTPIGFFDKNDPFGFSPIPRTFRGDLESKGWVGHWWLGGRRCYDRGRMSKDLYCFYREHFRVNPSTTAQMTYYLEINSADKETKMVCVKVRLPLQLAQPIAFDLEGDVVKLLLPEMKIKRAYEFEIEAFGYNVTESAIIEALVLIGMKEQEEQMKQQG